MLRIRPTAASCAGAASFSPAGPTAGEFKAAAQRMQAALKADTPKWMPGASRYGVPPPHLTRFKDLNYVHGGFLATKAPIGGDPRINANEIQRGCIGMMAPLDKNPQYMAALAGAIVDFLCDVAELQLNDSARLAWDCFENQGQVLLGAWN